MQACPGLRLRRPPAACMTGKQDCRPTQRSPRGAPAALEAPCRLAEARPGILERRVLHARPPRSAPGPHRRRRSQSWAPGCRAACSRCPASGWPCPSESAAPLSSPARACTTFSRLFKSDRSACVQVARSMRRLLLCRPVLEAGQVAHSMRRLLLCRPVLEAGRTARTICLPA